MSEAEVSAMVRMSTRLEVQKLARYEKPGL